MGCCFDDVNKNKPVDFLNCKSMEELITYLNSIIIRINLICKLIPIEANKNYTDHLNDLFNKESNTVNKKILADKLPNSVLLDSVSDIALFEYYEQLKRALLLVKIHAELKTISFLDREKLIIVSKCLNLIMDTEDYLDLEELINIKHNTYYIDIFKD